MGGLANPVCFAIVNLLMNVRRLVHFAILVCVPVIALSFFGPLERWRGPAYLKNNYDPDYAYLFNSLNILNGIPPGHRDHPGTTVQTWGGLTLRLKYPAETRAQITETVLKDPESALSSLSFSLSALCALVMILSGIVAAEAFGSIGAGVAFQLFPMLTPYYWEFLVRMTPDLLSMNLSCLFLALCSLFYLKSEMTKKQARVLGVVFGIAVASKITAIPTILIPLILLRKNRASALTLLGSGAVSFLVCIAPILRRGAGYFFIWNYQLMTHSETYGGGPVGLPSFSKWSSSAVSLMVALWMYPAMIGLGLVLLMTLFKANETINTERSKLRRLLVLSVILLLVQLVIVAKHPGGRYLMPAFASCSVILAVAVKSLSRFWKSWSAPLTCFSLAIFAFSLPLSEARDQGKILERTTAQEMLQIETQRNGCRLIVPFYPCSTKIHALFFGNNFARNFYAKDLDRLYPDSSVYDLAQTSFLKFDLSAIPPQKFAETMKTKGPVCLQGDQERLLPTQQPNPLRFQLLYGVQNDDSIFSLSELRIQK